jgi:hypothetical protein
VRYFIDAEFDERGSRFPITLLSLAIVAEDGESIYMINSEADHTSVNDWVKENVLPHLYVGGGLDHPCSLKEMRERILCFCSDPKPEFWGYYADYDWVVFCQVFGAMVNLPKGWPMFCRDIKQWQVDLGCPQLPKQSSKEHNALNDARWNLAAWTFLRNYGRTK